MPFVLSINWANPGEAVSAVEAAAAPLLAAGARREVGRDRMGLALRFVEWQVGRTSGECFDDGDLILAIDGYVIDPPRPAADLASLYRAGGVRALEGLDGSFVIAIVEPQKRLAVLLTDRAASRPMFLRANADRLLAAPELKCFKQTVSAGLDPAGVLSLLLNSFMLDELTYLRDVRAVGPARELVVQDGRSDIKRYWAPEFHGSGPLDVAAADDAILDCVRAHVAHFRSPALALSGGVDSRVILAAARRAGLILPTVTWAYGEDQSAESDFGVAPAMAAQAGVVNTQHVLAWEALAREAAALVEASDGLVGHLGAFADRHRLALELGRRHDAILMGDQCYRGEGAVGSVTEAVEGIGISTLPRPARRLAGFLLQADRIEPALEEYGGRLGEMLASAGGAATDPQVLHDRLYWQVRLPRLLTGPKALWRRYVQPVSPLLSNRAIDVAGRLAAEQRVHKRFLRDAVTRMAPDLAGRAYAAESSRVKWRRVLREAGPCQRFVVETLMDPSPEFDEWFDRRSIELLLRATMSERAVAVSVPADGFAGALARRARGLALRPVFAAPLVLNLLTLKLWMSKWR